MKRISLLVAVVILAGCADTQIESQVSGDDEAFSTISSLADSDVSSMVTSESATKIMSSDDVEPVDLSVSSSTLKDLGIDSISNLSEVDRIEKISTSDKLSLTSAAMEIDNLSEVDAFTKSISPVEVLATDIGEKGSDLVSEIQSTKSNIANASPVSRKKL